MFASHDKDYRCLAAFPPEAFVNTTFGVVRLDHRVRTHVEAIQGATGPEQPNAWLLVHRGHMRLLVPTSPPRKTGGNGCSSSRRRQRFGTSLETCYTARDALPKTPRGGPAKSPGPSEAPMWGLSPAQNWRRDQNTLGHSSGPARRS